MNYRRAFVPNGYLHIIITSYDRKPIFIENIDILRTAFKNTKTIYEFEIIAICVLPNHIHLILHPNNITINACCRKTVAMMWKSRSRTLSWWAAPEPVKHFWHVPSPSCCMFHLQ